MWDVIAWTQSTTGLTKGFVSLKELQLSLSGGPNQCARNVNICFGGWERVCGYLWDMQDAEVVSRKLGCGFPLTATDSFPSSNSYPYMSTAVNSEGTQGSMWECSYNYQYGVCHHGDAAVMCTGGFLCFGGIFLQKMCLGCGGMKSSPCSVLSRSWVHVPEAEGGVSEGASISCLQTVPGKSGIWAALLHRAGCEERDGFSVRPSSLWVPP